MIVDHYDQDTNVTKRLVDELKFPHEPSKEDTRKQYEYWAWRFSHLKAVYNKMPRIPQRQNIAIERDKAQMEFNRAKRRLFG